MYFTYLIKCKNKTNSSDKRGSSKTISFYCGYTSNPDRRSLEHFTGKGAKYTKSHQPIEMRIINQFKSRKKAMRNELEIKKKSKESKAHLFNTAKTSILVI
jgi:putative endonuclease